MFGSRTLFVVGAGASAELGMPIGSAIKPLIGKKLDFGFEYGSELKRGDWKIYESIKLLARSNQASSSSYTNAGRQIAQGMNVAPSIDNFLDAHKHDEYITACGKLGIASVILEAERNCSLYYNWQRRDKPDISKVSGSWLPAFAAQLVERISKAGIESLFLNTSFITFNYDRCIELFLYHAIQDYYSIDDSRAAEVMKSLTVYHPYGAVGKLPWQSNNGDAVAFGADIEGSALLAVSEKIKTFTERVEEQTLLDAIHHEISIAETIVFLGFSFQPQNMELLGIAAKGKVKRVFATAFGFSNSDCEVIKIDILKLIKSNFAESSVELRNNLKCVDLFSEYSRSITQ